MRLSLTGMSAVAMLCVAGCATRGNVELLESRIRLQEDQIFAAQRDLKNAQQELVVARREIAALRTQLDAQNVATPTPEQLNSFSRAEAIVISKMLSGGLDRDGHPGHDVFNTVITPVDANGDLAKVPGSIRLELIDLARDGTERTLGVWEFSSDEAESHWKKSFFGAGYAFQLPWKEPPHSSQVVLHARLTTTDGRQFDSTQELSIQPPAVLAHGQSGAARVSRANPDRPSSPPFLNPPGGAPLRLAPGDADADDLVEEPSPSPAVERSGFVRFNEAARSGRSLRSRLDDAPLEAPQPRRRLAEPEPQFEEDPLPPAEELDPPFDEYLPRPRAAAPRIEEEDPFDDRGAVEVRKPARLERTRPVRTSDRWTDDSRPVLR